MQDLQKWVNLGFLFTSIILWMVLRQLSMTVFQLTEWRPDVEWLLAPADWIGVLGGVIAFFVLRMTPKSNEFTKEAFTELAKVTWPPRRETVLSAVVVAAMLGVASLILFAWGL